MNKLSDFLRDALTGEMTTENWYSLLRLAELLEEFDDDMNFEIFNITLNEWLWQEMQCINVNERDERAWEHFCAASWQVTPHEDPQNNE